MFFFGIMGIDTKIKEVMDIHNITCKHCGRMGMYNLVKKYNYFHFFFIPIFRWGVEYNLVSRCCKSVFSLSKEKGKRLENGIDTFLDNKELKDKYNGGTQSRGNCPQCGNNVNPTFDYCPYCGKKL